MEQCGACEQYRVTLQRAMGINFEWRCLAADYEQALEGRRIKYNAALDRIILREEELRVARAEVSRLQALHGQGPDQLPVVVDSSSDDGDAADDPAAGPRAHPEVLEPCICRRVLKVTNYHLKPHQCRMSPVHRRGKYMWTVCSKRIETYILRGPAAYLWARKHGLQPLSWMLCPDKRSLRVASEVYPALQRPRPWTWSGRTPY